MQCGIFVRMLIAGACLLTLSIASDADPAPRRFDISANRVEGNTLLKEKKIQFVPATCKGKQREYGAVPLALEAQLRLTIFLRAGA